MEVWWSGGQVKLASVVLLVIISNQKQFQSLRLHNEQNNKLSQWPVKKHRHAKRARIIFCVCEVLEIGAFVELFAVMIS